MNTDALPLSRPIDVSGLAVGDVPKTVSIDAGADERAALAALLDLDAVAELTGAVTVTAQGGGRYVMEGHLRAVVHPVCVVTLEAFEQVVEDAFERHYATDIDESDAPTGVEVELSHDDADDPDPVVGGVIDAGAAVAEELALRLDAYPRKPGIAFESPVDGDADADTTSPFAKLAALKDHRS